MARTKKKLQKNHAKNRLHKKVDTAVPLTQHIRELRQRLFYIAVSIIGISIAAYGIQQHIVNALLRPAEGQQFIYTSPIGGLDFLFRVCLYTGIALSVPVIVYQLLRYFEPLLRDNATSRFVTLGTIASGVLALIGISFGYFVGLPTVLHFLAHQFTNEHIQALITIQSYMSFVIAYLLGSALLLQMPLVLLFINRIKPLKPSTLLKKERWVILGSVVLGGMMDPSPNVISQLMLAAPIIITYQVGILLVWHANRRSRHSPHVVALRAKDEEARAARMQARTSAQYALPTTPLLTTKKISPAPTVTVKPVPTPAVSHLSRPAKSHPNLHLTPTPTRSQPQRRVYTDVIRPRTQFDRAPLQNA